METPRQVKNQQLERVWGLASWLVGDVRHKGKYPAFAATCAAKAGYLGNGLAPEDAQELRTFAGKDTCEFNIAHCFSRNLCTSD
jgi:hypothetical protein